MPKRGNDMSLSCLACTIGLCLPEHLTSITLVVSPPFYILPYIVIDSVVLAFGIPNSVQ